MQLPEEFIRYTRALMGDERFQRYLESFYEEVPVSIRLNPMKTAGMEVVEGEPVPWCREGYYLPRRPQFTMDPLLHAGCYYVQEAASMFITHVLRNNPTFNFQDSTFSLLDLCAAPGGKSTAAIATLPAGSMVHSNEPMRQRAAVLAENIEKWGYPGCTVTCNYPKDYRASKLTFDIVICDVPCSGEGMFRRDESTIGEWSPQAVEKCWQLQRQIVTDAWACLRPGGLLIYSTCTFNTKENEENVRWMLSEFDDAEALPVETRPEWNITGSLLPGFDIPVYRFIPGITRSEGLFVCMLHKKGLPTKAPKKPSSTKLLNTLYPTPSTSTPSTVQHALNYQEALSYLRGESLTLPPDTPRGMVTVSFEEHPLGTVKNIGTRANNLYPKSWRIKTTHIPTEYEAILRHT